MSLEKLHFTEDSEMILKKEQIFVVDDDESVCRALALLLGTYGFTVNTYLGLKTFGNYYFGGQE
jgi:FixJ family two-component response regulator